MHAVRGEQRKLSVLDGSVSVAGVAGEFALYKGDKATLPDGGDVTVQGITPARYVVHSGPFPAKTPKRTIPAPKPTTKRK